ncbi:MAG: CvpA family protein [Desulfobulbus sp.]|jgi:membrane protein required for colicin V production
MLTLSDLTYLDLLVGGLFLVFVVRGVWLGCVRQLAALFGLLAGYGLAGRYAAEILPFVEQFVDNPKLTFLASFAIIFFVVALGCALLGKVIRIFLRITLMGWLDRLGGAAIGCLKAAVLASLLYMVLASTLSATNDLLRRSYTAPYLQQGSELLRALIADPQLRAYFKQKEPAIPPERRPAADSAAR